jgi:hypothetical protein
MKTGAAGPCERVANQLVARIAERIGDPVMRLRFLKMAEPRILDRPKRRVRRAYLVVIPLLAAAMAGVVFQRAPAKARPAERSAAAGPVLAPVPARPPEVWEVEKTDNSETFSNGLWIDDRYAVSNQPRAYLAFPLSRGDAPAIHRTDPAGIVFHTTESSQAAFSAGENGTLRRIGESLLDYVRRKRAYHFVIDRFGRVHRVVLESDAANHAGFSVWADDDWTYVNLNESFLGVAFEARTEKWGGAAINAAQTRAGAMLVEMLRSKYRIAGANCVTHAQVSVNPSNMQAGYHTDWAFGLPFSQLGLPDNYARDLPSLRVFGFQYAAGPETREAGVYASAERTEVRLREAAAAAGMGLAAYREMLRERFRRRFEEVRRLQPAEKKGSI